MMILSALRSACSSGYDVLHKTLIGRESCGKKWEKSPNQAWIIFRSTLCREKSNYTPTNPKDNSDDIKDFSPYKFLRYRSVKTAQKPQQKKNLFACSSSSGRYLTLMSFYFPSSSFRIRSSPPINHPLPDKGGKNPFFSSLFDIFGSAQSSVTQSKHTIHTFFFTGKSYGAVCVSVSVP